MLSELAKPRPEPRVERWLAGVALSSGFISVATVAELWHGIELWARAPARLRRASRLGAGPSSGPGAQTRLCASLAPGQRRQALSDWLEGTLLTQYADRVLPVDLAVAQAWGTVVARCERLGRPIGAMEALLAATAAVHGLTLATRDVGDYACTGVEVHSPWS